MQSEQLYAQILGVHAPWQVAHVDLDMAKKQVVVHVELDPDESAVCPECGAACPRHDTKKRSWRHLDTCQMRTLLTAQVPRASCKEHGVRRMKVPWAEPGSRFTALFEALVIDWLETAPTSKVAERLGLGWWAVDGIMQRAVDRGLAARPRRLPRRLGVDETSFRKRHEYVTVVHDLDSRDVIYVADGRGKQALLDFFAQFGEEELASVELVAMDMHGPYIAAVREAVPGGDGKIVFDKFHVAALWSKAVDLVRRQEHRALMAEGDERLKGSKYLWLRNPTKMSDAVWEGFEALRESKLRTARAWAIKETAMEVWGAHLDEDELRRDWRRVLSWAGRSKLEPIKRAAKTIRAHFEGVLRAQLYDATNASAESINSLIQRSKYMARGFRSRERFRTALLFFRGGLDLYPRGAG
ncbi:ISL3 family transposase [Pseudenhygromyxa sp. WMMC2535]|uniref:ISL3 family transposase n=1 Tax=Pseudenhygromyxa sp. WMMC2535 TaxID=2712867 RepID=UPI00155790A9|nr:ISL3 family transposase [Pseudenhygromyxa sp. WMMC2535]NVB39823.1 ISL3 family transposase [Pseudenhygromyxa sp. WMMC2535]